MTWISASNIEEHLGRYECIDPASNTNKYWELLIDADNPGKLATRWGRIGARNTQRARKLNCDRSYAAEKLQEKLKSGYKFAGAIRESVQMRLAGEQNDRFDERTAKTPLASSPRRGRL